jgi:hypothetical protein
MVCGLGGGVLVHCGPVVARTSGVAARRGGRGGDGGAVGELTIDGGTS